MDGVRRRVPLDGSGGKGSRATGRSEWLSLSEASLLLGVDPSTLRHWADAGKIQAFRTPGGHRRFSRQQIEALLAQPQPQRRVVSIVEEIERTGNHLLVEPVREWYVTRRWYDAFDEEAKHQMRVLGRQLLRALLRYLRGGPRQRRYLEEGMSAGRRIGWLAGRKDLLAQEAAESFLVIKRLLTEVVAKRKEASPESQVQWLRRLDRFMDRILVVLMEGYEEGRRG